MKVTLAAAILLASIAEVQAAPTPNRQGLIFLEKVTENDVDTYLTGGSHLLTYDGFSGLDAKSAHALIDAALGMWFSGGKVPSFVQTNNQKRRLFYVYLVGSTLPAGSPCIRAPAEVECSEALKPGAVVSEATYYSAYAIDAAWLHLPDDPSFSKEASDKAVVREHSASPSGAPVYLHYGTMLCGTPEDAMKMHLDLAFGSCKANTGGWAVATERQPSTVTYHVYLENGSDGWVSAHDIMTSKMLAYEQHSIPNSEPNSHCTGTP